MNCIINICDFYKKMLCYATYNKMPHFYYTLHIIPT